MMCGTGCHLWVGVLVFDLQTLFDKVETTILGAKSNPKLSLAALRKDHRCGRLWPGSFLKQEMLIPTLFLHPIHLTSILTNKVAVGKRGSFPSVLSGNSGHQQHPSDLLDSTAVVKQGLGIYTLLLAVPGQCWKWNPSEEPAESVQVLFATEGRSP